MKAPQILFAAYAAYLSIALGVAGCKGAIGDDTTNRETAQLQYPSQDPASANTAPVSSASDNTGAPPGAHRYSRPNTRGNAPDNSDQYSADEQYQDPYAEQYSSGANYGDYSDYDTPVNYAPDPPPQLPEYQQPPAPGDDYMWTPGCWNYDSGQGYYWVPGAWVLAPYAGALWTPGWWGYERGRYGWHRGFWGRHIGYYGGINYGHGYDGQGYEGGYWRGDQFYYNRSVNNINTTIVKNVYIYRVTNITNTRVSYNGGSGGIVARPRPREIAAYHEQHNPPMTAQAQIAQQARSDHQNYAQVNRGRPAMTAVSNPLPADRGVRPPAVLNYQAMRQEPPRPQPAPSEGRPSNQRPVEFQNNVHPVPGGSHFAQQNPPAPEAPRNNHQPAPGRPMMLQRQTESPRPERPGTASPEVQRPYSPPPALPRPEPQRPAPQPRPEQRAAPPQEHRSEPAPPQHQPPPARPAQPKPEDRRPRR